MKVVIRIGEMSCSACSNHIEKYLKKQAGILDASVNLVMGSAQITYDDSVSIEDIARFIKESGYEYLGIYNLNDEMQKDYKTLYIIFGIGILLMMVISMINMRGGHIFFIDKSTHPKVYSIFFFMLCNIYLIFGFDILKKGVISLKNLDFNMNMLVFVSSIMSYFYSFVSLIMILKGDLNYLNNLYFESCAMIIYFVKLGHFIEEKSFSKARSAISGLVQITPDYAYLKKGSKEYQITIDEVKEGDILICKPGMKFAVDGVITKGSCHVDESFITGESKKSNKTKGDQVAAGFINMDGTMLYKAEKIGPDSLVSEIVRLVASASNGKTNIGRIVDHISGYFIRVICLFAFLFFIIHLLMGNGFNNAFLVIVTVLVVACPCAFGLATPLAIVISNGKLAKKGIVVKNGEAVENIANCDTVIFDKTRTLTTGEISISKIYNYSDYTDRELINILANIEMYSSHPIKNAFNVKKRLNVLDFHEVAGLGINGKINNKRYYIGSQKYFKKLNIKVDKTIKDIIDFEDSVIFAIQDSKIIGVIVLDDTIKKDAKKLISLLYNLNKDVMILSGDNEKAVLKVAKFLNIKKYYASLMPKDKETIIKDIQRNGHKVLMIGDGVNDAPALSHADVSISINGATDIADSISDFSIITDDILSIMFLIKTCKETIKVIIQNVIWAFIYNFIMVILASGLFIIKISPMLASVFMIISSMGVIINSLRLR